MGGLGSNFQFVLCMLFRINMDLAPLSAEGVRVRDAWMYKPQDFIPVRIADFSLIRESVI